MFGFVMVSVLDVLILFSFRRVLSGHYIHAKGCLELHQTSSMERFTKIVNGF